MADYISRQKAIEAIMDLPNCPNGYSDTYDKACIIGILEEVPTADVVERKDLDKITEAHERIGYERGYRDGYAQIDVEVVRCKECKHWERDVIFQNAWCRGKQQKNPNWFCADGERREYVEETD